MEFPILDFDSMCETDVREEIIAPLLRHLGYRSGTSNQVIREQQLSYAKLSLGRRKPTDPHLRGKADYICEANGKVRWVIEAKAPNTLLDELTEQQAWSYANHPEVRAVYYAIVNGRELKIYQTNKGPGSQPLFESTYEQMAANLDVLENILSPTSILRDHPTQLVDLGKPIGPGLRSIVRVNSGTIRYTEVSISIPPMQEMIMTVTAGSVQRNVKGQLEAHLHSCVPFQALQELNEKLGLDQMSLVSTSTVVSTDASVPTVFQHERRTVLPKGMAILNLMEWKEVEMPIDLSVVTQTRAEGHLEGRCFAGMFNMSVAYLEIGQNLTLRGRFSLSLS